MPVRKIGNSHRSTTGVVTSVRPGEGQHRYESSLERDLLLRLDFDLRVNDFEAQPVRISYEGTRGQKLYYVPDTLARYRAGASPHSGGETALLCEVKYEAELEKHHARFAPKFKAARCYAEKRGWRFEALTEKDIRTPFLENVRVLRPLAAKPVGARGGWRDAVLSAFRALKKNASKKSSSTSPTADRIAEHLGPFVARGTRDEVLTCVWHLLARGHLSADLHEERLSGATPLAGPPDWLEERTLL